MIGGIEKVSDVCTEVQEQRTEIPGYQRIKPERQADYAECRAFFDHYFKEEASTGLEGMETGKDSSSRRGNLEVTSFKGSDMREISECAARMPRTGGEWTGEPGNSNWKPERNLEPGDRHGTNPEHKKWGKILDENEVDSIPFKDGEPDFSEVSQGEVEIDDFSEDRSANFDQADEKLADVWGCSPEEVAEWRSEHKYTWHECKDCKTMQLVPREIHGNIPHSGGISETKMQNKVC